MVVGLILDPAKRSLESKLLSHLLTLYSEFLCVLNNFDVSIDFGTVIEIKL